MVKKNENRMILKAGNVIKIYSMDIEYFRKE